jgi:opacity protein-like surface antigen
LTRALLAAALLTFPAAAQESLELGVHGGVFKLSDTFVGLLTADLPGSLPDVRVQLKDGWRFGFRLNYNFHNYLGHEVTYAYNRTQLGFDAQNQGGMAIHQGGYSLVMHFTPDRIWVRPFVAGGGHFANFVPPGTSATSGGGSTKLGFHYGGGLKVKVHPNWMVRFDFRQYMQGRPFGLPGAGGMITLRELSAGVSFVL